MLKDLERIESLKATEQQFHLFQILRNKDKIDTAEPKLSDTKEDINNHPGHPAALPDLGVGGGGKAG